MKKKSQKNSYIPKEILISKRIHSFILVTTTYSNLKVHQPHIMSAQCFPWNVIFGGHTLHRRPVMHDLPNGQL